MRVAGYETLAELVHGEAYSLHRLLEKAAEDRYQTAEGVRADLEVCAREWSARRAIAPFPIGARDISSRFLVPQRLYGRGPRRPARCEGPRAGRSRAEREQQHGERRDEDGGIAGNAVAF